MDKLIINGGKVTLKNSKLLKKQTQEKQFEAITEHHMGRPDKLNELMAFIEQVKLDHPKS